MRIAIKLEYSGTRYHGWQTQGSPPLPTLQTFCEAALSQVANHPVKIVCAGRTDRGVHAWGQIAHFETTSERNMNAWVSGVNHYLPDDIRVLWAKPAADTFHARHSAIARRYQYVIYNHPVRPALLKHRVSWYPRTLSAELMQTGADYLIGEHDFSAFRGADCQAKTTTRQMECIRLNQTDNMIKLDIKANAFLHHMVRNIVGVLLPVGYGEKDPGWVQEVLISRERKTGGITASPDGLYLMEVYYPEELYPID